MVMWEVQRDVKSWETCQYVEVLFDSYWEKGEFKKFLLQAFTRKANKP